jgi:uncharacterized membrane protein
MLREEFFGEWELQVWVGEVAGVCFTGYRLPQFLLLQKSVMESASDHLPPKPMSLHEFRKRRRPLRNIHTEVKENLSRLDRLAVWITTHVGTMGFFLIIVLWTIVWLGWNFYAPPALQFDSPMGFVFWLLLSNLIQILLMPLIMVGQNVIGRHAEARAEHDLQINMKNEQEIEVILHHLEHQNDCPSGVGLECIRTCI